MGSTSSIAAHIGRLVMSVATLAVAGTGIVTAMSGAIFIDAENADMDVSSGWVDVEIGGSTMIELSDLKPGDVFFRPINIANTGSLDFSYTLTTSRATGSGSALADTLQVETWETATADTCEVSTYQTGNQVGASSSLTQLSVGNSNLVAGTAETLCLRISLPSLSPNSIAGKRATVTFAVASQQL